MTMRIADLARKGGVGVETVRYYQRRGLLPVPPRTAGGRRYGEDAVRRLGFIRQAKAAGFTLEEISDLLALDATEDRDQARALARTRIAALDAQIAAMVAARTALERLADACAHSSGPCPILTAFDGG
ncbi:MerR family transcriptional regulator [Asticcacaulis sp. EMRT-3]|uniref:MerR family transcriptional regulator n=1 Tax=Asticcacaulis sp. EMRT-3 TaxID=3040349 RepID=UPI0024AFDA4B|nr:MerR family transcriptional regulator [Asticcacaulis sp. EMRT-3]MDI7774182.1 MerR family DNA-binding protein [Asticcacaulis sp. EMRT-3]